MSQVRGITNWVVRGEKLHNMYKSAMGIITMYTECPNAFHLFWIWTWACCQSLWTSRPALFMFSSVVALKPILVSVCDTESDKVSVSFKWLSDISMTVQSALLGSRLRSLTQRWRSMAEALKSPGALMLLMSDHLALHTLAPGPLSRHPRCDELFPELRN